MTSCVIYQYDSTGHIFSRTTRDLPENAQERTANKQIVYDEMVPVVVTTTLFDGKKIVQNFLLESGWSLSLDANGNPKLDESGNYAIIPPQFISPRPDHSTYIFSGMVNRGDIDVAAVDQDTINSINWALNSVNMPILKGTSLVAMPIRTAVIAPKG